MRFVFFLVGFNNENGGCKVLIVEKFVFIVVVVVGIEHTVRFHLELTKL